MHTSRAFLLTAVAALALGACGERTPSGQDISTLMSLHRGELAAVASYERVIGWHGALSTRVDLPKVRNDHSTAAATLAARIRALGGTPDTSPGVWGGSTQLLSATASAIGEKSALELLRAGEKHGQDEYNEALEDDDVDAETKSIIRSQLLPPLAAHIIQLEDGARAPAPVDGAGE